LLYYDICAGLQEALRVYVGTTSQCVHIADHVTYCYTVLWEMGCDTIFFGIRAWFRIWHLNGSRNITQPFKPS